MLVAVQQILAAWSHGAFRATGLPVLAGRSGGVEEAVIEGQTGHIMNVYQQARDIPQTMLKLLSDLDYMQELGRRGQERIKKDFVWENQLAKLKPWT